MKIEDTTVKWGEDKFPWYVRTSKKNYAINLLVSSLIAIYFFVYDYFILNNKFFAKVLVISYVLFLVTYRIMEYLLTGKIIINAQLPKYVNTGLIGFFWFVFHVLGFFIILIYGSRI